LTIATIATSNLTTANTNWKNNEVARQLFLFQSELDCHLPDTIDRTRIRIHVTGINQVLPLARGMEARIPRGDRY
jgi:hypothetical protein